MGGRGRRGRADPVGHEAGPRASGSPLETIATLVGTSLATQESVPAAFAVLALAGDDPWLACRLGASVGGDCDTIAAMAGAVAGACCGVDALPVRANVEHLDLDGLADALLALRPADASDRRRPGMIAVSRRDGCAVRGSTDWRARR